MEGSTAEYNTILSLLNDLRLAVQNDLLNLFLELQGTDPMILTPDNADKVNNMARTSSPAEASAELMSLVRTKVKSNPQCYYALVRVFEKNTEYYKDILEKLKKTLEEKRKEETSGKPNLTENIPEIYLSNANLAELLKLLRPVAAHWEHIAPLLKPPLPDGAIDAIKYENSGKPDSTRHCLREMLSKWLKRIKPCQPSWQTLRAAVDGAGIDGGDGIVKQIDDVIVQKVHQ